MKNKKIKYVGNIVKYIFTFIVTVMTFAAAIIPMMMLNTSDDTTVNPNCNPNDNCLGDPNFCTSRYPCSEDQGDCDYDNECNSGLICGSNNCPSQLEFGSTVDCCIPQSSRKHRYFHPSRNVTSHGARLSHNI